MVSGQHWQVDNSTSKKSTKGSLGGAAVWRLPLAQGMILETQDRIPHRAPSPCSLLLPLPVSLPPLCEYHKKNLKKDVKNRVTL